MIFKNYTMPEMQKEKYVLAIQAAKEVVENKGIKEKDYEELFKFLLDLDDAAAIIFMRYLPIEMNDELSKDEYFCPANLFRI